MSLIWKLRSIFTWSSVLERTFRFLAPSCIKSQIVTIALFSLVVSATAKYLRKTRLNVKASKKILWISQFIFFGKFLIFQNLLFGDSAMAVIFCPVSEPPTNFIIFCSTLRRAIWFPCQEFKKNLPLWNYFCGKINNQKIEPQLNFANEPKILKTKLSSWVVFQ